MYRKGTSIRQAPVFWHLRVLLESPWKFIIWMNEFNYTACCWFPTSSNILILPSQFWQIRFESYWLHCLKCRILVLLWYITFIHTMTISNDVVHHSFSLKGKFPQTIQIGWVESKYKNPTVKFWAYLDNSFCMSPSLDGTLPESVIL